MASPEATGGAGGTYESRAAAIALSRLLRGDRIEGLGLPIVRVRLQQRFAGLLFDDIVVEGTDPSGSTRVVEFQAKRQISPAKSDDEFVETVGRCLESINSDSGGRIAAGRHRFGIVAKPSTALHDLARVTEGGHVPAQVDHVEHQLVGQVLLAAPHHEPAAGRVHVHRNIGATLSSQRV